MAISLTISLFILSFYYFIFYMVAYGIFYFLTQFIGIYRDSINYEKYSKDILEAGLLGVLLGGRHFNARLAYTVNSVIGIFGILIRISLGFLPYLEITLSEVPVIVLWGLSSIVNFYAGMRAIPPRYQKEMADTYKKICKNALFRYFKQNQGKAFSINALKKRIGELSLKSEEKEYIKEHMKDVLDSLLDSEKIEYTVQNEELYYLIS
ncbi:MAG: hypothetical protein JSV62_02340 [Promethearchaeota archaeon]|nr:MAG: hypothetical protein JSV62_02340 [Candidatus Lokiarchaeota archaeon]